MEGFREHYIRDAQGNIMAIYRYTNNGGASTKLVERPVYGSSRLGSYAKPQEVMGAGIIDMNYTAPLVAADQRYELTDHLGNVSTVVTGRLLPGNGAGSAKQAEVISAQGYEPFGSLLPGRNFSSGSYRFGFNGHLKDDEVHGATGTWYSFGDYGYDPRIGRRPSQDPLSAKYPFVTPYHFSHNSPIWFYDPDGEEPREGNTVLTVNMDWSYIMRAGDQKPKFKTYDSHLNSTASDYYAWHTILGVKSMKPRHWAVKTYMEGKKYIDNLFGLSKSAADNGMEWKIASKSSVGYDYIEATEKGVVTREVRNLNEQLGVSSGFENIVTNKRTYELDGDGNAVATKEEWWAYRTRTNEAGESVVEYEHMSLDLVTPGASLERSGYQKADVGIYAPTD